MAVNELINRALRSQKPTPQFAYLAPSEKQAKKIAWAYLKDYAATVITKVNESELSITLINGARIFVCGGDNPDSLRGIYLDGVIIDEFAQVKASLFGEVIRPALSDRKGWAVFLGTPKGKGNQLWSVYQKAVADPQRWFLLHLKASESGIIGARELEELRKDQDESEFAQEYECSFEAAQRGSYYGKHIQALENDNKLRLDVAYDPRHPVSLAMDIGFNDATSIWFWQVVGGEVRFIDYIELNGQDAEQVAEKLMLLPYSDGYSTWWVPHDALHKTFASRKSVIDTFIEHGAPARKTPNPDAGNRVFHGVDAVRKVLRTWPVVFNRDKCARGLEALRNYSRKWDADRHVYSDQPAHDQWSHGSDAFRYACLAIKPEDLKRSIELQLASFTASKHQQHVSEIQGDQVVINNWTFNEAFAHHERQQKQRRSADRRGL